VVFEDNLAYLETLYQTWRENPDGLDPSWKAWLAAVERGEVPVPEIRRTAPKRPVAPGGRPTAFAVPEPASSDLIFKQTRVDSLLWAYRDVGYFYAHLNPLFSGHEPERNYLYPRAKGAYEQLSLEAFGLSEEDLSQEFSAGKFMQPSRAPLAEILKAFGETYCSTVGVEFLHIQNKPMRNWLLRRMEGSRNRTALRAEERRLILEDLIQAEEFEQFLHKTFIGQRRFSLEGAEALIPALHFLINAAARDGIGQIVLGTTHRGRITILNRVLGMPAEEVFTLFEDIHQPGQYGGSGDVKYHLGYAAEHRHEDGTAVRLVLVSNPSHLEAVGPVVEGRVRGLQSKGPFLQNTKKVLPVILHGDAAFSGQGVVSETLNLSQVQGYCTGGTLHLVINNQIGFTTSSRDSRSTFFPTDVAKMTSVPVFHVNGDDPEAVVHVIGLALEFRQKMAQDVVVDMICYRRHGHNEGDEPSFTNPSLYALIRRHPSVAVQYGQVLAREGLVSAEEQDRLRRDYVESLRQALKTARLSPPESTYRHEQDGEWPALKAPYSHEPVATGVEEPKLRRILEALTAEPESFHLHPKLKRILEDKRQRLEREGTVDWATAEALAFGSLLLEGFPVRLSGQDSGRGTFSQRHAVWWDSESPEPQAYVPLNRLGGSQARFEVWDSPLSEYSILAFEYGYALSRPEALSLWEAQFGDFANGAQVIIDNFLAAAEAKWLRSCGLVLLLPHGYEGQGPEHSSAHLERYLQLAAQQNMEVVNASTPAQYFHLLRRQVHRGFRKPLVVMSPKSLLRHPKAVSGLSELASGHFREVLEEAEEVREAGAAEPGTGAGPIRRLILCSGKLYYELAARRAELGLQGLVLVRVEQLYPFPREALAGVLDRYRQAQALLWAQEEPENRGALSYMRRELAEHFPAARFEFVSRPASASPAVGSHRLHEEEQLRVVDQALGAGQAAPAVEGNGRRTGSGTAGARSRVAKTKKAGRGSPAKGRSR
jgi:2-oxoglutarate dehydrogenase E1 component